MRRVPGRSRRRERPDLQSRCWISTGHMGITRGRNYVHRQLAAWLCPPVSDLSLAACKGLCSVLGAVRAVPAFTLCPCSPKLPFSTRRLTAFCLAVCCLLSAVCCLLSLSAVSVCGLAVRLRHLPNLAEHKVRVSSPPLTTTSSLPRRPTHVTASLRFGCKWEVRWKRSGFLNP
ncbi:hypothetical protein B0T25DRAFT_166014 [Lasiosphaeria hispida]|uniref:Uncharacterized protein n=1 Tax=Lasiosphaeria hispida TaxID=260671 RepID=A0AAJ0HMV8_9PEZI|nr:hypothetical protein B0T25DRAFT_166014 [Lasiosphaeria hispida]